MDGTQNRHIRIENKTTKLNHLFLSLMGHYFAAPQTVVSYTDIQQGSQMLLLKNCLSAKISSNPALTHLSVISKDPHDMVQVCVKFAEGRSPGTGLVTSNIQ